MSTSTAATAGDRPAHTRPEHSSLGWALRDTAAITRRNLVTITRLPQLLVFSLVQPMIFVVMFRYVFGGSIKVPGVDSYVDYLMPGIFVQTVAFGAISTAIGLAEDKNKGLIERLRSLPMNRGAVLGGRTLADTLRNVFIIVIIVGLGFLVGFRIHNGLWSFIIGLVVLLGFGFALAWLFALIGLSVPNGEAAQAAAFPLLAPLVFASNAFVDPRTLPGWLQGWARNQPVSATVNAVRTSVFGDDLGRDLSTDLLVAGAWIVGLTLLFAPVAIIRFRRS